eukprot:s1930_g16.t1
MNESGFTEDLGPAVPVRWVPQHGDTPDPFLVLKVLEGIPGTPKFGTQGIDCPCQPWQLTRRRSFQERCFRTMDVTSHVSPTTAKRWVAPWPARHHKRLVLLNARDVQLPLRLAATGCRSGMPS